MLKKFKPTSPGVRGKVMVSRRNLHKGRPYKALTRSLRKSSGRNNSGRLVNRRKGGGVARRLRVVDFFLGDNDARIERLEYDPNRSGWLALVRNSGEEYSYCLAGDKSTPGDRVGKFHPRVRLSEFKEGEAGFNLSSDQFGKAKFGRSAGTTITVKTREGEDWVVVKLPSGELKRFRSDCWMSRGQVSNPDHNKEVYSKAGTQRRRNRRFVVRGMAQNAVDHPMGSKSGKSKGRHPKDRWGNVAKGKRTRHRPPFRVVLSRKNAKK